jgi:hypothetical protein
LIQGLDSLGYKEHLDYDLVESTNPAFGKAIVRVNVFRAHRQVRGRGRRPLRDFKHGAGVLCAAW